MESFLNSGIVTDLLDKEKVEMELMRGKIKKIKEDIEILRVIREANKRLDEEKERNELLDNMEKCWKETLECVEEIQERYERNKIDEEEKEQIEEFLNRHIECIGKMEDFLKQHNWELMKTKGVSKEKYLEMIRRIRDERTEK